MERASRGCQQEAQEIVQTPEQVASRTVVVNLYREPYDVYIGRKGKGHDGTWGNPFSNGTRGENIARYYDWIRTQPDLLSRLWELKGKRLGCFCKPLPCHGDVLVELVHEYCK